MGETVEKIRNRVFRHPAVEWHYKSATNSGTYACIDIIQVQQATELNVEI